MDDQPKECRLLKVIDTVKQCSDAGERFCFILGAGASVSSGISSGAHMAQTWLDYLKEKEPEETDKWIEESRIDESDIGQFYSLLYERRFSVHPLAGYIWLQEAMKNAAPGLGYYHLASILAAEKTSINLVITTNFDSLAEDAIFMYTHKKPQVVTHEQLAKYMNIFANRPVIAKIHRDLLLGPMSSKDELIRIAEAWEPALKEALRIYSPIVIGYGGNDDSLMGLLETAVEENAKENGRKNPIYWCHMRGNPPASERIIRLLAASGGFLVPIDGFDTAMYLFGAAFGHTFSEEVIKKESQARIDAYNDARKTIEDRLKDAKEHRELSDTEEAIASAITKEQREKIRELTEAINKSPRNPALYNARGDYFDKINREEDAIRDYTKAIELDPNNALYYSNRGACYVWVDKLENAVEDITKAIGIEPDNPVTIRRRGLIYARLTDYENALKDYQRAVELDPMDNLTYNNRASTYFRMRDYEKAIADYKKAIEINPDTAFYYTNLAEALHKAGYIDQAFDNLDKALSLDKNLTSFYSIRGYINLSIAKKNKTTCDDEVINDLNKAIELGKHKSGARNYYNNRAEYYLYIGDLGKAYEDLQKALQKHSRQGRAWYDLAKYHKAKGDDLEYERCLSKSQEYKYIPDEDDYD